MSDLVGNPEDQFSRVAAHLITAMVIQKLDQSLKSHTKKKLGLNQVQNMVLLCK